VRGFRIFFRIIRQRERQEDKQDKEDVIAMEGTKKPVNTAGTGAMAAAGTAKENRMECRIKENGFAHAETGSPRLVERRTGLRGQSIGAAPNGKRPGGARAEKELLAYDSDVPYAPVEKALRTLVCALTGRQDRVTEALLLRINDLQYRLDDHECAVEEHTKKPVNGREGVAE